MPEPDQKPTPIPSPFALEDEEREGVHVISIRGELDLNTAQQLEERLEGVDADVLIDLSGCEFIDSTGIGLLVRTWQRLDAGLDGNGGGSRLALCGPGDQVRRLLEITGLESSLRTYAERGEALAALREG